MCSLITNPDPIYSRQTHDSMVAHSEIRSRAETAHPGNITVVSFHYYMKILTTCSGKLVDKISLKVCSY
jgi:hypothetical protein